MYTLSIRNTQQYKNIFAFNMHLLSLKILKQQTAQLLCVTFVQKVIVKLAVIFFAVGAKLSN